MTHEPWAPLYSARIWTLRRIPQAVDISCDNCTNCGPQVQHFSNAGILVCLTSCRIHAGPMSPPWIHERRQLLPGKRIFDWSWLLPATLTDTLLIPVHIHLDWMLLGIKSAECSQHTQSLLWNTFLSVIYTLHRWLRKLEPCVCHRLMCKHYLTFCQGPLYTH